MIKCNVCQVEKELINFQQYWHSTQQKMRTRKQCTDCLYNIRLKRKNPDKFYENNPNYHKCNTCSEWKELSKFFTSKGKPYSNRCRECTAVLEKEKSEQYKLDNCGGGKVPLRPNKYQNDIQKQCTFELMKTLGYLYDVPTGIWYKPGVKEIVNGKPFFPNIKKTRKPSTVFNPELIELIDEYTARGLNARQISIKLNLSHTTIYKYVKRKES